MLTGTKANPVKEILAVASSISYTSALIYYVIGTLKYRDWICKKSSKLTKTHCKCFLPCCSIVIQKVMRRSLYQVFNRWRTFQPALQKLCQCLVRKSWTSTNDQKKTERKQSNREVNSPGSTRSSDGESSKVTLSFAWPWTGIITDRASRTHINNPIAFFMTVFGCSTGSGTWTIKKIHYQQYIIHNFINVLQTAKLFILFFNL